ncbi:MAG: trigger factor [Clostridia bacterium]
MADYEKLENSRVKFTITVSTEEFNDALTKSFLKNAKHFNIPGFRKGKAPRSMVESVYGEGVLYDDAVDFVFPEAYEKATAEFGLNIIGKPEITELKEIGKNQPLVLVVEVDVAPTLELCDYKGIEVPKGEYTVTDAETEDAIKKEQKELARYEKTEREAQNGDLVIIDYSGTIDGVLFNGGTAENQTLELGSNQFIPGFEDQVIGMKSDEERDITVAFPADYPAEDLKGKDAVFHIKLHEVRAIELPEANDEFAKDVSEFDTFEEYRNSIKEKLEADRKRKTDDFILNSALEKIISKSSLDIPQTLIDEEVDDELYRFERNLERDGMSFETFLKRSDMDKAKLREYFSGRATDTVKGKLVIEKIVELENIDLTDEEKEAAVAKELKNANISSDSFDTMPSKDTLLSYIYYQEKREKAAQLIIDNCKMVDADEKEVKPADQ